MSNQAIVDAAVSRVDRTLDALRQLVELESPSSDKAAVDRLIDHIELAQRERGARIQRLAQSDFGDLLVARFGSDAGRPLLVMTHIDTVWPVGTIERLPFRVDGDTAHGPGIYDMKASVAIMFTALDILREQQRQHRPIVWIVNTDEEVGSPVSRPVLEHLAAEAAYVLCLEPPVPPHGALKTERKGVGMFTMEITGRAAHAGADHQSGISALEELARQIQWLHSLTDYERGTTLNVGVASGGTKRNVVAAQATAQIDLRVTTMAEANRIVPLILNTRPLLPGATVDVAGELNRPPMERSQTIVAAFERAREIGRSVGQDLREGATGGGSDGNFTAAIGAATLDGLGAFGDGAHADTEHIVVSQLGPRTALITALLAEL